MAGLYSTPHGLIRLGWRAKIPLREGVAQAYANFLARVGDAKLAQLERNVRPY
jgi:hypothetical protein